MVVSFNCALPAVFPLGFHCHYIERPHYFNLIFFSYRILDNAARYGYNVARGAPRHPQSQGKVERFNRTVGELLGARYVELGQPVYFKWWKYVQSIVSDHNFSKCGQEGASPYQVHASPSSQRFIHLLLID